MSGSTLPRVDPRALLRAAAGAPAARDWRRAALIGGLALVGLAAFGAVVVRANDDAGVLAFIKHQTAPSAPAARSAQGGGYWAPRSFFPSSWSRRTQRDEPRLAAAPARPNADRYAPGRRMQDRDASFSASYAPSDGLAAALRLPLEARPERRLAAVRQATPRPAANSAPQLRRGGAVAYCVRTCDGYFFPLGPSSGSDAGDSAACRSLCPAAETRLYSRRIGEEMEESRARKDGRRYSALSTAFQHRNVYDAACSCTGRGPGLATNVPAARDATLRAGDAVMTPTGMKVFSGGRAPHRESSFTPARRSPLIDSGTREALRTLEQASLPGRSGVQPRPLAAKRSTPAPIVVSANVLDDATSPFRYVGPNGVQLR